MIIMIWIMTNWMLNGNHIGSRFGRKRAIKTVGGNLKARNGVIIKRINGGNRKTKSGGTKTAMIIKTGNGGMRKRVRGGTMINIRRNGRTRKKVNGGKSPKITNGATTKIRNGVKIKKKRNGGKIAALKRDGRRRTRNGGVRTRNIRKRIGRVGKTANGGTNQKDMIRNGGMRRRINRNGGQTARDIVHQKINGGIRKMITVNGAKTAIPVSRGGVNQSKMGTSGAELIVIC